MKLFKVYLVYGKNVVMHLYWAGTKAEVWVMMGWKKDDKPKPIIEEIPVKAGCCMCHHIADHNFHKDLEKKRKKSEKEGILP